MSGRARALTALLSCFTGVCIVLSWVVVFGLEQMAPVPLGWCPILVFTGSSVSVPLFIASILAVIAFYAWISAAIFGVSRRRRWGTVSMVVLLTMDAAVNVVLTITTWWYLLAIVLDILLLILAYRLYRAAENGSSRDSAQ